MAARRSPAPAPAPPGPPLPAGRGGGAGAPPSTAPAPSTTAPGAAGDSGAGGGRSSGRFNQTGFGPTAGGVLLGAFGVVLFVQYSRGGPAEVRAWFAAKFLNNASGGSVAAGTNAIGQGAQILGQGITLNATGTGGQSGAGASGATPSSPPSNKQGLLP